MLAWMRADPAALDSMPCVLPISPSTAGGRTPSMQGALTKHLQIKDERSGAKPPLHLLSYTAHSIRHGDPYNLTESNVVVCAGGGDGKVGGKTGL